MPKLMPAPPTQMEVVTDVLHGVPISDPYRWLENPDCPRTRHWIAEQTDYARSYLDRLPGRVQIRDRVRDLLDLETYDSFLPAKNRIVFRKRLRGQEQFCIYIREGTHGPDELLIDPRSRRTGDYTAIKPLCVSADARYLLYEVKCGGESTATFEVLDVPNRRPIADALPHGTLYGFAFAPDGRSFYYIHQASGEPEHIARAVFHHVLGNPRSSDKKIFVAGQENHLEKVRLTLVSGPSTLGFLVRRWLEKPYTDFYLYGMGSTGHAIPILRDADYLFSPRLLPGRIFALIDQGSPNRRIVEVQPRNNLNPLYFDLVAERQTPICHWALTRQYIIASYTQGADSQLEFVDQFGTPRRQISDHSHTLRLVSATLESDEIILERESFVEPSTTEVYSVESGETIPWLRRSVPFESNDYTQIQESFPSTDGTPIPISLAGKPEHLRNGAHPLIMTSYGGYGVSSTPQFSVLAAFLMEQGCLFAVPHIRGGSEFGSNWHLAAKRRNRQVAFNDFLAAAGWLISQKRAEPQKLAIFGGSNSGLLVGAAMTQRPDLFCAVLCLVPLLDMLRYHLFDDAIAWRDEFGSSDDLEDFKALLRYSPYHRVLSGTPYPAVLFVSGDLDHRCNPLHARKMTARLQASTISTRPILLSYDPLRGHSPVLPLSVRVAALTDRLAFLCQALGILPN